MGMAQVSSLGSECRARARDAVLFEPTKAEWRAHARNLETSLAAAREYVTSLEAARRRAEDYAASLEAERDSRSANGDQNWK